MSYSPSRFTKTAVISCPPFSFRNELVFTNLGTFLPTANPAPSALFATPPNLPTPLVELPAPIVWNEPTEDDGVDDFNFVNAPRC